MRTRGALALAVLALAALSPARAEEPASGVPVIDPAALRAHMRFLADDLLQGRAAGSEGYELAARYVAARFEALGLTPAGTNGYLQPVPLRAAELGESQSWIRLTVPGNAPARLRHLEQVLILPSLLRTADEVEAPIVFAGYGITAPDLRHDDYASIDVRGKVVAVLMGAPARFPDVLRAHHSSPRLKAENAAAHGASGLLVLAAGKTNVIPWAVLVRSSRRARMAWMDGGQPSGAVPGLHGAAMLGANVADRILAGAGRAPADVYARAEAGEPQSFATGTRAVLHTVSRHRELSSPNVAALLRGADEGLRGETVVYSAHLDHLGIGEPMDGDRIYNGAVDNASGVAALLEIAAAMAARPPRRSVLFLAVTAEESGLLGSDYFAHHPTVPRESIVADINIDGLGLMLPSSDVVGIGAGSSSLGETLEAAARRLGVEVSPDPVPAQALFIRSDQYSFVRQGIPSLFVNAGFKPLRPGDEPGKLFQTWLGTVYHSPRDDMAQPIDFAAGARLARVNLLVGMMVADQPERPRWKPDDFFGRTYGRKAAGAPGS